MNQTPTIIGFPKEHSLREVLEWFQIQEVDSLECMWGQEHWPVFHCSPQQLIQYYGHLKGSEISLFLVFRDPELAFFFQLSWR